MGPDNVSEIGKAIATAIRNAQDCLRRANDQVEGGMGDTSSLAYMEQQIGKADDYCQTALRLSDRLSSLAGQAEIEEALRFGKQLS